MCVVSDPIVTDSCKLPRRYWDLNLGPLKEQLVFLTTEHLSGPSVSFFKDLSSASVQWQWVLYYTSPPSVDTAEACLGAEH